MTRHQRLQRQIRRSPARQRRQLANRKGRAWAAAHTTPGLPRG